MQLKSIVCSCALLLTLTTGSNTLWAQAPERPRGDQPPQGQGGGRREGGGEGRREGGPGGVRMNPLFTALDTNSDGTVDEKELNQATASLKKLDKNNDGKLTMDEVRPAGMGGRGQAGANPEEMVTRLMAFDKNADGKLSKDELPERMQAMMERGDSDKDGFLSKDEIRKLTPINQGPGGARREGGEGGRREGGPGGGEPRP